MASSKVKPESLKVGDRIKFKVYDISDQTIYSGKVIGISNYNAARIYGSDIAAQNDLMNKGRVAQLGGTSASDYTNIENTIDIKEQTFIIVECADESIRPFAFSWLKTEDDVDGYVSLITEGRTYIITVYDCNNSEINNAMQLLRDNNYVCKLTVE